jgi:hypothetical protein
VPPRHTAVPYEEEDGREAQGSVERDRRRAVQSEMAKAVLAEFGDEPEEEMEVHGGAYDEVGQDSKERELRDFEEENFVRLMLSKKQQKARGLKLRNELKVLDDFTDLDALGGGGGGGGGERRRRRRRPTLGLPKGRQRSLSKLVSSLDVKNRAIAAKLCGLGRRRRAVQSEGAQPARKSSTPAADRRRRRRRASEPTLEDNPRLPASRWRSTPARSAAPTTRCFSRASQSTRMRSAPIGKRIEKNRGLVRPRNEKRKTPRSGLRNKHGRRDRRSARAWCLWHARRGRPVRRRAQRRQVDSGALAQAHSMKQPRVHSKLSRNAEMCPSHCSVNCSTSLWCAPASHSGVDCNCAGTAANSCCPFCSGTTSSAVP